MGGWLTLRTLGVDLDLEVPTAEALERLRHQWSRALRTGERAELRHPHPPNLRQHLDDPDAYDYDLTTRVTAAALAQLHGACVTFHAAGLADDDGRVLVLVAASGTGKTTAVATLGRSFGYLSDETVAVRPDGQVLAHPKPLSVIGDPAQPTRKHQLSPDDAGLGATPGASRLARLVVLRREPARRTPPELVALSSLDAVVELLPQTSGLSTLAHPLARLLGVLDACGGAHALRYREIAEAEGLLRDFLAAPTLTTPTEWTPLPPLAGLPEHNPAATGTRWQHTRYVDAGAFADEVLVLRDHDGTRLDALTATVWRGCATPQTLGELVALAQREHGNHADATPLVQQSLEVLQNSQLVTKVNHGAP